MCETGSTNAKKGECAQHCRQCQRSSCNFPLLVQAPTESAEELSQFTSFSICKMEEGSRKFQLCAEILVVSTICEQASVKSLL